jgi:hypothetical protein
MKSIADLPSNILIHILAGPATGHDDLLAHGETTRRSMHRVRGCADWHSAC